MSLTSDRVDAPLGGLRVLDVTRSIAGPWTARLLGDAGAEIIKIEPPPSGDLLREFPTRTGPHDSAFFRQANAGKRSVCVDLHDDAGVRLVRELAAKCDVVIQNMRPAAAARCGLTYEALSAVNPNVIVCAISGYGQDKFPDRPGNDIAAQAMTGIAALTGEAAREPVVSIWSLADTLTAAHAFNAICAALLQRERTGRGAALDIAITRCAMQLHDVGPTLGRLRPHAELIRGGAYHPFLVLRGVARAADGFVAISAYRRTQWRRLAQFLGEPYANPKFDDPLVRFDCRAQIIECFQDLASKRNVSELVSDLEGLSVPVASVPIRFDDVVHQLIESGSPLVVPVPSSDFPAGALGNTAVDGERGALRLAEGSPRLGGDALRICRDLLGMSREEIQALFAGGVLHTEPDCLVEVFEEEASHV